MIVGFSLLVGGLSLIGVALRHQPVAINVLLVAVAAIALWWRRRYPAAVLAIVFIATSVVGVAVNRGGDATSPALAFAVYAVSVYGGERKRFSVAVAAIVVIATAVIWLIAGNVIAARLLIPVGAISLVAWVIGDYIRSRRRFFAELVARHNQERQQAAEDERLRIARELHDVVAHNVSAMAIQAGAARVTGTSSEEALESIERGARDTLAELNKLLGVLRKSSGAPLAPQPTLAEVDNLLRPARDAGLQATLKVTGDQRPLPTAVELSAYRIVQEAITNVLKHAAASRVEVAIDYRPDAILLTIGDNGGGAPSSDGGGHGLIGMRERAELVGGDLTTGSSALGGFTVRATLPVKT